jgi:hypothetical protein
MCADVRRGNATMTDALTSTCSHNVKAGKSVQLHTLFLSGEIEPSAADSLRRPHGIWVVIILNVAESVVGRSGSHSNVKRR